MLAIIPVKTKKSKILWFNISFFKREVKVLAGKTEAAVQSCSWEHYTRPMISKFCSNAMLHQVALINGVAIRTLESNSCSLDFLIMIN